MPHVKRRRGKEIQASETTQEIIERKGRPKKTVENDIVARPRGGHHKKNKKKNKRRARKRPAAGICPLSGRSKSRGRVATKKKTIRGESPRPKKAVERCHL